MYMDKILSVCHEFFECLVKKLYPCQNVNFYLLKNIKLKHMQNYLHQLVEISSWKICIKNKNQDDYRVN